MPSKTADSQTEDKITTRPQAEAAVALMAKATAMLGIAIAAKDEELNTLAKEHTTRVEMVHQKHGPLIEKLSDDITRLKQAVSAWAQKNRASEFEGKKSLEFDFGVLKFHAGSRSVEIIESKEAKARSWKEVIKLARRFLRKYLVPKWDVDKRGILRDTDDSEGKKPKLTAARLAKVGLCVKRGEETFEIEFRPGPNTLKKTA